jgi:hypothetical protein
MTNEPRDKAAERRDGEDTRDKTVYASQFEGAGLASKVANALDWLKDNTGGQGRVRVTPKDDGVPWSWDTELTIDQSNLQGIGIDIDQGVLIDYPGHGVAITLKGTVDHHHRPKITGGSWTFSGDPTGWLRMKDTYGTIISPASVNGCSNATTDAFAVSIENHDGWSEATRIENCRLEADRAVQFKTAATTGGSGTKSFQETYLDHATFVGNDYCIKTAGNMDFSQFNHCTFRPGTDGADCLFFAHDFFRGGTVLSPKFEDTRTHVNTTGIKEAEPENGGAGDTLYSGPMIVEAWFENLATNWDTFDSAANLTVAEGKTVRIESKGTIRHTWRFDLSNDGNGGFIIEDGSESVRMEIRDGELVAINADGDETTLT